MVAVAGEAAVDVLDPHASAAGAHAGERVGRGSARPRRGSRRPAGSAGSRAPAPPCRGARSRSRRASASSPSRAKAEMWECMRSRSRASACWTSTGSSPMKSRPAASAPPRPTELRHGAKRSIRPQLGAVADGALDRPAGVGRGEDRRLQDAGGAQRLEVVEEDRPVGDREEMRAARRRQRATNGRCRRTRPGSAPLRSPYRHQRAVKPASVRGPTTRKAEKRWRFRARKLTGPAPVYPV